MANLVQSAKGYLTVSTDLNGTAAGSAAADGYGADHVNSYYSAPPTNMTIFTAPRPLRVLAIYGRVDTAAGSASSSVFRKVPSGTAPGSGTLLHSGSYNLQGTANNNQALTLSTTDSDLRLAAGDSIVAIQTGTTTSAAGGWTIDLAWL